jgi:hypothetical protein
VAKTVGQRLAPLLLVLGATSLTLRALEAAVRLVNRLKEIGASAAFPCWT